MPAWLSPELIAIVIVGALLLGALILRRPRASAPADDARALEQERADHRVTRDRLQKVEGDWREASVHAGRVPTLEAKLADAEGRVHALEKELAGTSASTQQREAALKERIAALGEYREEMKVQFQALAHETLTVQSEAFTKTNKEKLDGLIAPLREQITNFQNAFVEDGRARTDQGASLREQIATLLVGTEKVYVEANNLAKALKGQAQVQGAWGEMILRTILEKSGLRPGEEFTIHDTQQTEDGRRLQPDVTINLPGGQKLVIDSKASLTAFERCVNCEDEHERSLQVRNHTVSLRGHIKGLSEKDYSAIYSGVDFVIMFVPIEGALSLALQNDPEITSHAITRNVFIASPTTLLMALRTIENLWRVERQNRNADEIARVAGKLYSGFVRFISEMKGVEAGLVKAQNDYDKAFKRLATGRDNLVRLSQRVKDMGAKTNDSIPDEVMLLGDSADVEVIHDAEILSISNETRAPDEDRS